MSIALILKNWKLVVQGTLIIVVGVLGYHYFISNPKKIDALEEDKTELSRQLSAKDKQLKFNDEVMKAKGAINAQVYANISTLRSTARPRRTVIIRAGRVLSPMHGTGNTTR